MGESVGKRRILRERVITAHNTGFLSDLVVAAAGDLE